MKLGSQEYMKEVARRSNADEKYRTLAKGHCETYTLLLEAEPDKLPRVAGLSAHNPAALHVGEEYLLVIPNRGSLKVRAGRSGTPGFYGRWALEVLAEV